MGLPDSPVYIMLAISVAFMGIISPIVRETRGDTGYLIIPVFFVMLSWIHVFVLLGINAHNIKPWDILLHILVLLSFLGSFLSVVSLFKGQPEHE